MNTSMTDIEFKELARKCHEGIATDAEREAFDEAYQLLLKRYSEWDSDLMGDEELVKTEIYQNLIANVDQYKKRRKIHPIYRYISAAAVLLIVGLGAYFLVGQGNLSDQGSVDVIQPGSNKAILTLGDGRTINLSDADNGDLIQQSGIQITKSADGQLVYEVLDQSASAGDQVIYNTVETPRGGQHQISLPDGTKVWLNAASSLKFPSSFASLKERRVELQGEAYFEVTKDKLRPFSVLSDGQEVEVLGTHFNINSYKDEVAVKTTLLEGRVKVNLNSLNNASKSVYLNPGEQSILLNNTFTTIVIDPNDVVDWKNGDFIFQSDNLIQIMNKIARWYDVQVVYDKNVDKKQTFSGQVSRSWHISTVLKTLESTGEVSFKVDGSKIIVK